MNSVMVRVRIRLKILYSNFLFIHHEAEVGIWFYIVKTAIQAEICVAKCLKCGAFCSAIQSNSHPGYGIFLNNSLFCAQQYHGLYLFYREGEGAYNLFVCFVLFVCLFIGNEKSKCHCFGYFSGWSYLKVVECTFCLSKKGGGANWCSPSCNVWSCKWWSLIQKIGMCWSVFFSLSSTCHSQYIKILYVWNDAKKLSSIAVCFVYSLSSMELWGHGQEDWG